MLHSEASFLISSYLDAGNIDKKLWDAMNCIA